MIIYIDIVILYIWYEHQHKPSVHSICIANCTDWVYIPNYLSNGYNQWSNVDNLWFNDLIRNNLLHIQFHSLQSIFNPNLHHLCLVWISNWFFLWLDIILSFIKINNVIKCDVEFNFRAGLIESMFLNNLLKYVLPTHILHDWIFEVGTPSPDECSSLHFINYNKRRF